MKRELTILVFLLAACGSVRSTTTNPAPTNILSISATPNPLVRIKSFVFNSECPQLCWLDIHPGVTTYDASKPLLSNSPQIIQSSTIDEPFVRTKVKWNPGGFPVYVDIHFEKGIVSTIQFVGPAIATMNDMINLIGKPEEISINIEHSPDSTYGVYAIRYPVSRTIIESEFINLEGPDPSNYIKYMVINGGLEDYKSIYSTTHEQEFQKWLGFGHLEDYLRSTNSLTTLQPTEWDLVDLYLRRDITDPNADVDWPFFFEERSYFGSNTDRYIESSNRDTRMYEVSKSYIQEFMSSLNHDPCQIDWRWPSNQEVEEFLRPED